MSDTPLASPLLQSQPTVCLDDDMNEPIERIQSDAEYYEELAAASKIGKVVAERLVDGEVHRRVLFVPVVSLIKLADAQASRADG